MAMCTSWQEAKERLKKIREEQKRCSDEVVELWENILCDLSYKLGSEEWVVYEQVCIAACDSGRPDIAEQCFRLLQHQFPSSMRVRYLQGLILEASEEYDKALELYNKILKEEETNSLVRKRKVAIFRAQNKTVKAIEELNHYLQQYMSDFEAWLELCDMYLHELDYSKAAFCMEELLLANPYNHILHQKYAEIKYTQGGTENMELARKYFAQSLKLNASNMRALFGFYLSANYLAQKGATGKAKKDNSEYAKSAWEKINEKYELGSTDEQEPKTELLAIQGMFDSMHV